jgi:uncharacterized protein YjiS (DUF1127 family)
MSQSFVLQPYPDKSGTRSHLPMLWRWFQAICVWLTRRHGWQDLNLLDDRMLKDVGITREQVIRIARQPFWRRWAREGTSAHGL